LSRELLEEIRLLLNFETYTEKQLQIIMVGQPELRQLLNSPDLRQLKQRISLRCEIKPLKSDEVSAYIRARLKVAGATRLNLFSAAAIAMIFRASEGIPRLVNNICDNALLAGFSKSAKTITPAIVAEIANALDLLSPMIEEDPRVVMESSAQPLPVMSELPEEKPPSRSPDSSKPEAPSPRRRSPSNGRRRKSRHQDVTLLRKDQIENMRLKVISVTDGDHEAEDEFKAG
jgi:hypothetical protein